MDVMPRVSIIILNWNGWEDTIECLESVYQITYPNYDVIVVDNGSKNESIDKIKEYAEGRLSVKSRFFEYTTGNKPLQYVEHSLEEAETGEGTERAVAHLPSNKKLILIKNGKNFGFAEGNNIGIRYALKVLNPGYILLLNNDTVVDKNFLTELVKVIESDEMIAFVGPKNYYYDYQGRTDVINFAGGKITMWKGGSEHIGVRNIDEGQYDCITNTDYVTGACLLARREVLEAIGLLDPVYFLYWEETDWCMRARNAGYKLIYVPSAKIWHKVAASQEGGTNKFFYIRNSFMFVKKNATKVQYAAYLLYFFGFKMWQLTSISVIYKGNVKEGISIVKGAIEGIKI
jgi:GT2 family glycosyltransferase